MKKGLAMLSVLLLVSGLLAGCQSTPKTEPTSETPAGTTDKPTSDPTPSASSSTKEERLVTAEDFSFLLEESGLVTGVRVLDSLTYPDWSKVTMKRSSVEPSDKTVTDSLNMLLTYFPIRVTDRAIQKGDMVNLDYTGKLDGVAFAGGSAKGSDLEAGSPQFVDNFLTKIIGHKPGETFDIEITFPDPYQPNTDLSGKLTIFTVTVNYISEQPELTDEFVKQNAKAIEEYTGILAENAEDLRKQFRDHYFDANFRNEVYAVLSELEVKEIPKNIYDYVYNATDISLYTSYGYSLETAASRTGMTKEELKEHIEKDCIPEMYFQAIAEAEGWTISESNYQEVTGSEDNARFVEIYGKGYMSRTVLINRAMEYLKEHLTFTD